LAVLLAPTGTGDAIAMTWLETAFVLGCAGCGWVAGHLLATMARRARDNRPRPAMDAAPAPGNRPEPPLEAPGGTPARTLDADPGIAPGPDVASTPQQILALLGTLSADRAAAEDRLLEEIRAAVSADDPGIRARLDRIATAVGLPAEDTPEPEDGFSQSAATDDAPAPAPDLDQWQAEFRPDGAEDAGRDAAQADADQRVIRQISVP
jgi:hypothetical protein